MMTTVTSVGAVPGDVDISRIGALLADPARCRMLMTLYDGRALPAGVLAAEAGVSASTASSHLAKLAETGLLRVESNGRFRYYRLAGPQVGALLEQMTRLAPTHRVRSLREGSAAARLREARTCYDHLAGKLGVGIMAAMIEDGYLDGGDGLYHPEDADQDHLSGYGHDVDYRLTGAGQEFLDRIGVEVPLGKRALIRYCVDWSEQRHHVAGRVGRAVQDRFLGAGWIRRRDTGRAILVTDEGREVLAEHFHLAGADA